MLLSFSCGKCPSNHSEFSLYRPNYNTGVSKLGERIGVIDNYKKTGTSSSSYTDFLKSSNVFLHLRENRPDVQFRPQDVNAPEQHLIQIKKRTPPNLPLNGRRGVSYLATLQGRRIDADKTNKTLTFEGDIAYSFNNGYTNKNPEQSALFVKKDNSIVINENASIKVGINDTITWSDYQGDAHFNENEVKLFPSKDSVTKDPILEESLCLHKPCQQFTDDWSFYGGPGDEVKSIPKVLSNKRGYRSRLVNTKPGVDVKHNSYERYLARKKGNIKTCAHF